MSLGCEGNTPAVPRGDGDNGMAPGVRAVQGGGQSMGGHRGPSKGKRGRAGVRRAQEAQQDGGEREPLQDRERGVRGTAGAAPRDIAGWGHRRHSRAVTGYRNHCKT